MASRDAEGRRELHCARPRCRRRRYLNAGRLGGDGDGCGRVPDLDLRELLGLRYEPRDGVDVPLRRVGNRLDEDGRRQRRDGIGGELALDARDELGHVEPVRTDDRREPDMRHLGVEELSAVGLALEDGLMGLERALSARDVLGDALRLDAGRVEAVAWIPRPARDMDELPMNRHVEAMRVSGGVEALVTVEGGELLGRPHGVDAGEHGGLPGVIHLLGRRWRGAAEEGDEAEAGGDGADGGALFRHDPLTQSNPRANEKMGRSRGIRSRRELQFTERTHLSYVSSRGLPAGAPDAMNGSMSVEEEARWLSETVGWRRDPELGVIEVKGEEARDWLNGQLTQDLRVASPGESRYSLRVDTRGKIQTDLWVLDQGDDFLLLLPRDLRDPTADSLDGFIIMEDVEVEALPARVVFTLEGPAAPEVASLGFSPWSLPRLGLEGRAVVVLDSEADAVAEELRRGAAKARGGEITSEAWELARLRRGVPEMSRDFGDFTLPQEVGLAERAVSFDKGCYVGQEPIVMLEHRGRPPKRLIHLEIEGEASVNDDISLPEGAKIGRLTSVVADPSRPPLHWGLGYVKRALAAPDAVFDVGGVNARALQVVGE